MRALRNARASLERRYLHELGFGSGKEFTEKMVASARPGEVFLDLGCGEGRMRTLLSPDVRYVGIDLYCGEQANEYSTWCMRPTVLGDIHAIPLVDQSCSTVALNHVLEHAREPEIVLREIVRILKPGGHLFMDVPFLHEIHHAPHDYFRFTKFALHELARKAQLEVVEIRPSGGYCRALGHFLGEATSVFPRGGWVRYLVAFPLALLGFVLRKFQYVVDLEDASQTITAGYHCIFRKL